jgi:hypothetical protein
MEINDDQLKVIIGLLILSLLSGYISLKQPSDYEPNKSIFCGTKRLPQGYGRYGDRYECLKRGFGAGMYRDLKKYPFRKCGYIFILIVIGMFIYNYYKKKEEKRNKN